MFDDILQKLSGRRSFLGTALKAVAALALAIVGVPKAFAVVVYKCCNLCANSSSTCTGTCSWSWTCGCKVGIGTCTTADTGTWSCLEFYNPCTRTDCPFAPGSALPPNPCTTGWICSKAVKV